MRLKTYEVIAQVVSGTVGHFSHETSYFVKTRVLALVLIAAPGTVGHRDYTAAIIRLVLLEVPVQVRLLAEAPFTQGTLERLLFVVDIPNMALQVG